MDKEPKVNARRKLCKALAVWTKWEAKGNILAAAATGRGSREQGDKMSNLNPGREEDQNM